MEPDRHLDAGTTTRGVTVPSDVAGPAPLAPSAATDEDEQFLAHRAMLYGLAYRLLGSYHDAEDVLQEAFLRWSGGARATVREPRRYLTRVVARLAIDKLRYRQARRETYVGQWLPEPVATDTSPFDAIDTSDLSMAMLHLMERLTPPQRAVYVLRTAFDLPYDDIAAIVGRTPEDCRQLHRRAGHAVRADQPRFAPNREEYQRLLSDFMAAARDGDLPRLEAMLHADVIAYGDGGGRVRSARNPIVTPAKVARFFAGIYGRSKPTAAVAAELNGVPALIVKHRGGAVTLSIDVIDGAIIGIYVVANPDKLTRICPRRPGHRRRAYDRGIRTVQ